MKGFGKGVPALRAFGSGKLPGTGLVPSKLNGSVGGTGLDARIMGLKKLLSESPKVDA